MTLLWPSPPTDPAYTHFVAGLSAHWGHNELPDRWRWHPKDGLWYSYPLDHFTLEDVGLKNGPTATAWVLGDGPPSFFDGSLVSWFNEAAAAYRGFAQRYPHACWDPATGQWRAPQIKPAASPPPPTRSHSTLPKEALDQIANVRALVAEGVIPPDEGDRLVAKVVEKWST